MVSETISLKVEERRSQCQGFLISGVANILFRQTNSNGGDQIETWRERNEEGERCEGEALVLEMAKRGGVERRGCCRGAGGAGSGDATTRWSLICCNLSGDG